MSCEHRPVVYAREVASDLSADGEGGELSRGATPSEHGCFWRIWGQGDSGGEVEEEDRVVVRDLGEGESEGVGYADTAGGRRR